MGNSIIELKNVNKHFGDLHVLKDINLSVKKGEVVVIIGPSGSGKSTLCRTVNRLETIDSGEIYIDGELLPGEGKELARVRSEVGMVFQSFNLFNNMTVLQNCMICTRKVLHISKSEAFDRAITHLKEVGMAPYINAKPAQLSGGQKRRAAIAGVLAMT